MHSMNYCLPTLLLLIHCAPRLALRIQIPDTVDTGEPRADLDLFKAQLVIDKERQVDPTSVEFSRIFDHPHLAEKNPCGKSISERFKALEQIKFLDHKEGSPKEECLKEKHPEIPVLRYPELQCEDHQNHSNFVYIDLGARWPGNGGWFLQHYQKPSNKKFRIHAFEADPQYKDLWAQSRPDVDYHQVVVATQDTKVDFQINKHKMGKMVENPEGQFQAIDFDRWIRENIKDTDFVVVKMDIEGMEHTLIEKMIKSGTIKLVDELFMECHYNRYSCRSNGVHRADQWPTTYNDCRNLFGKLRQSNVWVHSWS